MAKKKVVDVMKGIFLNFYFAEAEYMEKGKEVAGIPLRYVEAVISEQKRGIVNIIAGEASIVLRQIYNTFTNIPSFSLAQADEIINHFFVEEDK